MEASLLLLDGERGLTARLDRLELVPVPYEPDRRSRFRVNGSVSGALPDSARDGAKAALRLLQDRDGRERSLGLLDAETTPLSGSVIGDSAALLFGIATYIGMLEAASSEGPAVNSYFAATGILDERGNVGSVDGIVNKIEGALAGGLGEGCVVFYPHENDSQVSAALRERCAKQGLELQPVRHLLEALRRLRAIAPFQRVTHDLREYLEVLQDRLDYVDAPGDWSQAERDPSNWKLTELYWPAPIALLRLGAGSFSEISQEDEHSIQPALRITSTSYEGSALLDTAGGERFGSVFIHSRISVVGEQGVGKGCLLRHTAIAYALNLLRDARSATLLAINSLPNRPILPLFIDARDTQLDGKDCLDWSLLLDDAIHQLRPRLTPRHDAVKQALANWIHQGGEILLIVDGLDEAPNAECVRQIDDLAHWMQRSTQVHFIRSARWSRGRLKPIEDASIEVQLRRLELGERRGFLLRLLEGASVPDPASWAERALDLIDDLADGRWMSRTPLFLTLLASSLRGLESWRDGGGDLREALLWVMFQRSNSARRLVDYSGWVFPAAQLALSMSMNGEQQIEEQEIHRRIVIAFAGLAAFPIARRISADEYTEAMKASGLLRERRRSQNLLERYYDFGVEELQSWLAITALFNDRPTGAPGQSENDAWIAEINKLKGSDSFRIGYDRHDLVRQALLKAPQGVASDFLDLVIRPGADENLCFTIRAMNDGLVPRSRAAERLIQLVTKRVDSAYPEATLCLWSRLANEGTGPEVAPKIWARILGLYGANLPGFQELDLTPLRGMSWLGEDSVLAQIHTRLAGVDVADACGAAFEVLDWAFRLRDSTFESKYYERIEPIVWSLMDLVDLADVRSEFALWALRWITQREAFRRRGPRFEAMVQLDRIAAAMVRADMGDVGIQNAASLLCLNISQETDPTFDWAASLDAGSSVGSIPLPAKVETNFTALATLRAASVLARTQFAKGRVATAIVIAGGDHSDEIKAAIKHSSQYGIPTALLVTLAALPPSLWLEHLTPVLTSTSSSTRLRGVMLMLSFASLTELSALRRSSAAYAWSKDVQEDVDFYVER